MRIIFDGKANEISLFFRKFSENASSQKNKELLFLDILKKMSTEAKTQNLIFSEELKMLKGVKNDDIKI